MEQLDLTNSTMPNSQDEPTDTEDDQHKTRPSSSSSDDDIESRHQNAQLQKSRLLLQKKELEEQLLTLERQRRWVAADHEATLTNLQTTMKSLGRAKYGLLQHCSQVEDIIRQQLKKKVIDAI
jgi:hypothetical protein